MLFFPFTSKSSQRSCPSPLVPSPSQHLPPHSLIVIGDLLPSDRNGSLQGHLVIYCYETNYPKLCGLNNSTHFFSLTNAVGQEGGYVLVGVSLFTWWPGSVVKVNRQISATQGRDQRDSRSLRTDNTHTGLKWYHIHGKRGEVCMRSGSLHCVVPCGQQSHSTGDTATCPTLCGIEGAPNNHHHPGKSQIQEPGVCQSRLAAELRSHTEYETKMENPAQDPRALCLLVRMSPRPKSHSSVATWGCKDGTHQVALPSSCRPVSNGYTQWPSPVVLCRFFLTSQKHLIISFLTNCSALVFLLENKKLSITPPKKYKK